MSVKPNLPAGKGQVYDGQIDGHEKFAEPSRATAPGLPTMDGLHDDIGEKSGFQGGCAGYIVKKGTCYGEAARFNYLPPGTDINDQECRDIREMPMKQLIAESYPGDGWEPAPRDLPEAYAAKTK